MRLRWWLLLVTLVAAGGVYLLFGHDEEASDMGPLVIGHDTTRLVEPVVDGRVDYLAALRAMSPAPPAEDNAAIPLLRVLGTDAIVGDVADVLARLGAPGDLPATGTFVPMPPHVEEAELMAEGDARLTHELIEAWLDGNRAALDAVVEATRRPRLWLPLVRVPADNSIGYALPFDWQKAIIEALVLRSGRARVLGDLRAGWSDAHALLRLTELDRRAGMVARLVATGGAACAKDWLQDLFATSRPSAALCTDVEAALSHLPLPRSVIDDLDVFERCFAIDLLLNQAGENPLGLNPALRSLNREIDAVVALLRRSDDETRARVLRRIEANRTRAQEIKKRLKALTGKAVFTTEIVLTGGASVSDLSGEMVGHMVVVLVPTLQRRLHLAESMRHVVIVASALRRYEIREGAFPDSLDALVPDYLPSLPVRTLDGASVSYARRGTGCRVFHRLDEDEWSIELSR